MSKVWDKQHGGSHYQKYKIQPSKFVVENELLYPEGCAIKYIIRHQDKNSIYDKILKTTGTGLSVKFLAKAMINDAESVLLKKRKAKQKGITNTRCCQRALINKNWSKSWRKRKNWRVCWNVRD